ncbi:MAG: hypothetical protein IPJ65_03925 [Archangiaceae bacterium]|nr:hypothetical protein [Archangiaceae bacterium]
MSMSVFQRGSKSGDVRDTAEMKVPVPTTARQLTGALTRVLNRVETESKQRGANITGHSIADVTDQRKIASQMAAAALGKTDHVDIIDNDGKVVKSVAIDPAKLDRSFTEVLAEMQAYIGRKNRFGFEAVESTTLGPQLADLADAVAPKK